MGQGRWVGSPVGCFAHVNEWVRSNSRDCLLRPEVDIGAVLESELGQKWR